MDALSVGNIAAFEAKAARAADTLKLLANKHRLHILCHLIKDGEMPVNALCAAVGLSQSALSQHLARMRADGLVAFRREGQTVLYRIGDPRVARILDTLAELYC